MSSVGSFFSYVNDARSHEPEKMRSDHVRGQYVTYKCDIQSECGRINVKKKERYKDESRKVPERIVRITMDNSPPERKDTSKPHKEGATHEPLTLE